MKHWKEKRQLTVVEYNSIVKIVEEEAPLWVDDFNHFSINKLRNGQYIVFYYVFMGSYCKTNYNWSGKGERCIEQQLNCKFSTDDECWYEVPHSCGCNSFEKLNIEELSDDWFITADFRRALSGITITAG